jgi:hypothetical protein
MFVKQKGLKNRLFWLVLLLFAFTLFIGSVGVVGLNGT